MNSNAAIFIKAFSLIMFVGAAAVWYFCSPSFISEAEGRGVAVVNVAAISAATTASTTAAMAAANNREKRERRERYNERVVLAGALNGGLPGLFAFISASGEACDKWNRGIPGLAGRNGAPLECLTEREVRDTKHDRDVAKLKSCQTEADRAGTSYNQVCSDWHLYNLRSYDPGLSTPTLIVLIFLAGLVAFVFFGGLVAVFRAS